MVNDQDFTETLNSFAQAAFNAANQKAVVDSGFISGGFFIQYLPWADASEGAKIKTQALTLAQNFSDLKVIFVVPAAQFTADVLLDLAKFLADLGNGIRNSAKWLPWMLFGFGMFAVYRFTPRITSEHVSKAYEKVKSDVRAGAHHVSEKVKEGVKAVQHGTK